MSEKVKVARVVCLECGPVPTSETPSFIDEGEVLECDWCSRRLLVFRAAKEATNA